MKKEESIHKKYLFWAIIAILLFLSYLMLKPYLVYIISSFILAYLVKPLYDRIEKKTGKTSAGLLSILVVAIIVITPIVLIIGGIADQASLLITKENISFFKEKLSNYPIFQNLNIEDITQTSVRALLSILTTTLSYIPTLLLGMLIIFFGMYYILTNWEFLSEYLSKYIPFENKDETIKDITKATNGIIYGTVLVSLIEFFIAGIAFYLLGVKYYLLLASIIFFTGFIPGIGPGIVWVPLAIYYFFTAQYVQAFSILFVGLVLISILADNIIRAKLLQKTSQINPFIMLLGIIGGVSVFGIFGFIIGPLVLVYTIKIIENSMSH